MSHPNHSGCACKPRKDGRGDDGDNELAQHLGIDGVGFENHQTTIDINRP